jgi:hypothetical protein
LLDLHRDPRTVGAWTGEWIRPESFTEDRSGTVSPVPISST